MCDWCGNKTERRFCSNKCKWTWHNHNRKLPANVTGWCEVCGDRFGRYVAPSAQTNNVGRFCSRTCAGKWRRRENHPMWNGGRCVVRGGYVMVHAPDHPHANKRGYVYEHRLVMEKKIGRLLKRSEVVHHLNDDPSDNRLRNLRLYPNNAAHKADDYKRRKIDQRTGRMLPKGSKR